MASPIRDGESREHRLVFLGRKGEPLEGSALRRRHRATLDAAGLHAKLI